MKIDRLSLENIHLPPLMEFVLAPTILIQLQLQKHQKMLKYIAIINLNILGGIAIYLQELRCIVEEL